MNLYKFISNMLIELKDRDYFRNEEKYTMLDIRAMLLQSLLRISVNGEFIFNTGYDGSIHFSTGYRQIIFREDTVEIINYRDIDNKKYDNLFFKDETEFVLVNGRKFHNTSALMQ